MRLNQVWRCNNHVQGFYAYKNYLIGMRYGIIPLIIPREKFRFNRLKWLISYSLFIFNSKNVEREKRRYENSLRSYLKD